MNLTTLSPIALGALVFLGTVVTAFFIYLGTRFSSNATSNAAAKTAEATVAAAAKAAEATLTAAARAAEVATASQKAQTEQTMIVTHIDDRKDLTHALQQSLEAAARERTELRAEAGATQHTLKAELASFRAELDKVKSDSLDYKERLGTANVKIEQLQGQIVSLNAQNLQRKQESEAIITRLNDENVTLKQDRETLRTENQSLRAEVNVLRSELGMLREQVNGNSREIHEIGGIEVKVQSSRGVTATSLQAVAQEQQEAGQ